MRLLRSCIALAALAALPALPAAAQTAAPDPQTIMAASRAALGAATPVQTLELSGAYRLQPLGSQQQQQGTLDLRFGAGRQYQRNFSLRLPFGQMQMTQTLDGDTVWSKRQFPGGGGRFRGFQRRGRTLSPEQRAAFQKRMEARMKQALVAQWARGQMEFLLQPPPGATLRYAGLAKARNGMTADMIAVSDPAWGATASPVTLFLDTHSHRLLMVSYSGLAPRAFARFRRGAAPGAGDGSRPPRPQPQTVYVHLTHWRQVQGHWFPFEITQSSGGQTFAEWEIKQASVNSPKLTARVFQKP
ncbi:MAG: hypothetical protein ACRD2E_07225 [Terriglobales bacterium]